MQELKKEKRAHVKKRKKSKICVELRGKVPKEEDRRRTYMRRTEEGFKEKQKTVKIKDEKERKRKKGSKPLT